MYGVLIAEDEMLVRMGLKSSIDWEKHGMQVVGDAADGLSAWEIFNQKYPDVVITDLRMPGMDGIELIERIRRQNAEVRIVILTCLEDFGLVQKALSLGVSGYFLKLSMTEPEMDAMLQKMKEELDRANVHMEEDHRRLESDVALEFLVKNFMIYGVYSEKEFQRFLAAHSLPLGSQRLQVCAVEIDNYAQLQSRFQDEKGDIIHISLLNVLNEILREFHTGIAVRDTEARMLLLFNADRPAVRNDSALCCRIAARIRKMMAVYFNISVTFGLSRAADGFAALGGLYREALAAARQKYFLGSGGIYWRDEAAVRRAFAAQMDRLAKNPRLKDIIGGEKAGQFALAVARFSQGLPTEGEIRRFLIGRLQWIFCQIRTDAMGDMSSSVLDTIQLMEQGALLEESVSGFERFLSGAGNIAVSQSTYSPEIYRTLQYMGEHYRENITLNQAAQKVGLSAGYLSNLFKQETGTNFVVRLNGIRMERAARLLVETNGKTCDIAGQVGFTDSTYFCRVFRKVFGKSPSQYRLAVKKAAKTENEKNSAECEI